MHSSKKMIVHRDIKHENIMFANETSLSIKLIDFGLSRVYHKNRLMTTRVGTLYTMSPETIDGIYNSKADLWSVGVVAFMLLSGGVKPFWGKNRYVNGFRSFETARFPRFAPSSHAHSCTRQRFGDQTNNKGKI